MPDINALTRQFNKPQVIGGLITLTNPIPKFMGKKKRKKFKPKSYRYRIARATSDRYTYILIRE